MKNIKIIANGVYIPKNKVSNSELESNLRLQEGYIYTRTGILNRNFADKETLEYMAIKAGKDAIEKSEINIQEIEMIIVATTSTNKIMPGISYLVQQHLDIKNCMCLDVLAGCSGYINAFDIARNYIILEKVKTALIIGVDILSTIVENSNVSTSIILADGAGATILQAEENNNKYYLKIESIGQENEILTYHPNEKIHMQGDKIYKYAVTHASKIVKDMLNEAEESLENIKYIIPHQSNIKIIKGIAKRLNCNIDKFYINIEQYGNTFCASIPIAINELYEKNLISKGDKVILLGYGGGLNTGCILLEM